MVASPPPLATSPEEKNLLRGIFTSIAKKSAKVLLSSAFTFSLDHCIVSHLEVDDCLLYEEDYDEADADCQLRW